MARGVRAAAAWCAVPALALATPTLLIYAIYAGLGQGIDFPPLYFIVTMFAVCFQISVVTTPLAFTFGVAAIVLGLIALVTAHRNATAYVAIALGLTSLLIVLPDLLVQVAPDAFLINGYESWY
ncbi:MAG: hypothetical protein EPO52_16580 [Herbiconiux sp.]|uniref:hypothetical protein n=1 Tax=Herbiconiux sp. TaxID=1871186 RepID=UPI0012248E1B|nr:hypothetical protein [Herbiconiux sp.]TAJ46163.1 MAG: hypothetical protein EPO52_16580 [Herbiconiux sp.]